MRSGYRGDENWTRCLRCKSPTSPVIDRYSKSKRKTEGEGEEGAEFEGALEAGFDFTGFAQAIENREQEEHGKRGPEPEGKGKKGSGSGLGSL